MSGSAEEAGQRVGIALGTWRIAVAASNGAREHFGSLAGWPRTAAARRLIGRDVVFGTEAFRLRAALDLVRPFEGGRLQGPGAARAAAALIAQAVRLARPVPGERTGGILAVPADAARHDAQALQEAARDSLVSVLVRPEWWCAARGAGAAEGAIVVDCGAGSIVVGRFTGSPPAQADECVLPGGGDAVDLDLLARLRARVPGGEFSIASARELKERYGCLSEGGNALVAVQAGGRAVPVDVGEAVAAACSAPLGAVLDAVARMLPADLEARPFTNVLLAGGGGQTRGFDRLLEAGVRRLGGGRVTRITEPVFAAAEGALALASEPA